MGVPFTVVEKSRTVGGIWHRYPGAGVDTPNHLYSFSFAPYDWSKYFALRDELKEYLEHVADKFDLRPQICFNTAVEALDYDATSQRWRVTVRTPSGALETLTPNVRIVTEGGQEYAADILVIATGFDVLRFLTSFEARGRSGRSLRKLWNDDDAKAYLGTVIPDFPNFFCLYGPNL